MAWSRSSGPRSVDGDTMASKDTQPAMTYPPESLYEDWTTQAEEMEMSVSEWMQAMIEAGRKGFQNSVSLDETELELRQQRNDLKRELRNARDRIEDLEDRLHEGERAAIIDYVRRNPGATYEEVVQHVQDSAPGRIDAVLESLEGDKLLYDEQGYYTNEGVEVYG